MNNNLISGMAIGFIIAGLLMLLVKSGGDIGQVIIAEDCDISGSFMVDDVKYECRRADDAKQ